MIHTHTLYTCIIYDVVIRVSKHRSVGIFLCIEKSL